MMGKALHDAWLYLVIGVDCFGRRLDPTARCAERDFSVGKIGNHTFFTAYGDCHSRTGRDQEDETPEILPLSFQLVESLLEYKTWA